MKRATAKVRKVRKDGVTQAYHEATGPKSKRSDRDALRASRPDAKPSVDVDGLRDAVAFDDFDAARAYGSDEREYIAESIEVHGGSEPKVILTRSVYLPVGDNYGAGWSGGEAEDLAQEAFDRGDREVNSEDVENKVLDTWTAERENAEENYFSDSDAFDGLRERLEEGAAEAGIDLDGVTVEEVETVEARDVRPDLGEAAQAELDALWEEADKVAADNRGAYGFDKKTGLALDGYDDEGYSRGVSVERSYDRFGYNRAGYNRLGYNRDGVNQRGFDLHGVHAETGTKYDRDGYNDLGYDAGGWNREGQYKPFAGGSGTYDSAGYNSGGLDSNGFDRQGIHWRTGTTRDGYGLDQDGYGADGHQSHRKSDVEGAPGFGGVNARHAE